ncbi:ATP-binding protein [Verrucomicrobia bacterium]|nr:ATP-binding protein [Verrucomicrobiota bacterium]
MKERGGVLPIDLSSPDLEKKLYLLKSVSEDLTLRGQLIGMPDSSFFLAASPWVQSPDNLIALDLDLADFAVHDPILDLLNVIQSERMASGEIKALVNKLSQQKASLKEANHSLEEQNRTVLKTQQELEIQASEARKLAHVASRTDNAVIITNDRGEIEWVNESFEKLTEFNLNEVKGITPGKLLQGPETDQKTVKHMNDCLKNHEGFNVEIINYSKSGRRYWIRIEVQPILDSKAELTNFIAVETDITAQKLTEDSLHAAKVKAELANAAMSEFLATVSHEIRTPMNGIIGMLEILMDTKLEREQRNYISLIRVSSESLVKIINDVLDLSKIQSDRFELELKPFELRKLTDEVVLLMSYAATKKKLDFEVLVHTELPNNWIGDGSRLRQILINLVGNAIKFTEEGSVEVRVGITDESSEESPIVYFEVSDTGVGIPTERLNDIFKPFTQLGRFGSHNQQGTGLGLSICSQLVNMMHGKIEVESTHGQGSSFRVEVPFETDTKKQSKPRSSIFGKKAITVIPNSMEREVIENHLKTKGMKCRSFANPNEGFDCLQEAIQLKEGIKYFMFSENLLDHSGWGNLEEIFKQAKEQNETFQVTVIARATSKAAKSKDYPFYYEILYRPLTYEATGQIHRATGAQEIPDSQKSLSGGITKQSELFDKSITVLLVEDHPINIQQMTILLKRLGIIPDIARNGLEAVEAVKKKVYDVLLMDCQMPVMDGIEATREIRKLYSKGSLVKNPYIIAITAFALKGDREKCLEAGMDNYISKPVYKKDVIETLKVALKTEKQGASNSNSNQTKKYPLDAESAFEKLCSELSKEAALTLTQALIELLPGKRQKLEQIFETDEREAISRFGHSMKSICRMNGLQELAELNAELEGSAKNLNKQDLGVLIKVIQREIKDAEINLTELVQTHSLTV